MTRTRRLLTLIGLAVAITVAGTLPASATSSEPVAVSTSVATCTVAPPTPVKVDDYCRTTSTWKATTGTWNYAHTYHATVSCKASTTARGVSGYRVVAHPNNGTSVVMAETAAATTSVSASVDQYNLQFQPRVTVPTLTSYGWTADAAKSPVLAC